VQSLEHEWRNVSGSPDSFNLGQKIGTSLVLSPLKKSTPEPILAYPLRGSRIPARLPSLRLFFGPEARLQNAFFSSACLFRFSTIAWL
jgi:hypothetical protein